MSDEQTRTDRATYKIVTVRACDLQVGDVIVLRMPTRTLHREIVTVKQHENASPPKVSMTFKGTQGTVSKEAVELVEIQVESGRVS